MEDSILVSICCITYNHQKYIAKAIDGFFLQKTNFRYEIIIGEDCSTDNTLSIIKNYQDKYPDLIKIVLSNENIGANRNLSRVILSAKGEYIAICEGDDFWIDETKLQNQFDLMQENKVNLSFTKSIVYKNNEFKTTLADYGNSIKLFTLKEVINGGGAFIPTQTIMIKKSAIADLLIQDWFLKCSIGDYFMQIIGAIGGDVLFIPNITSAYRIGHSTSWSIRKFNKSELDILSDALCFKKSIQYFVENGVNEKLMKKAISKQIYYLSNLMLMGKMYHGYKKLIVDSFQLYPLCSMRQVFSLLFCFSPSFCRYILLLKYRKTVNMS